MVVGPRLRSLGKDAGSLKEPMRMCLKPVFRPLEGGQKAHRHLKALRRKKSFMHCASIFLPKISFPYFLP